MDRTAMLDNILERYAAWYDIERMETGEEPLVAAAAYHEHTTGFALLRKAEMWSADRHEYVYFFSLPELTAETYEACYTRAMALGEKLVDPKPGHMCTAISVVLLCDRVNEDAKQKVIRCRFRKSFRYSLWGWMEARTCAVDLEESAVYANPVAHETERFMSNLLHPRAPKRHLFGHH